MRKRKAWLAALTLAALAVGTAEMCSGEFTCTPPYQPSTQTTWDGTYHSWHDSTHHYLDIQVSQCWRTFRYCLGWDTAGISCCDQCSYGWNDAASCTSEEDDPRLWDWLYWPDCWTDLGTAPGTYAWDSVGHCAGEYKIYDFCGSWVERFDTTFCGPGEKLSHHPDHNNLCNPSGVKEDGGPLVGVRPKPGSKAEDTLHAFGDTLPYEFNLTADLPVRVWLTTSTYEGRCMNYPVNEGQSPVEPDTISDMVPVLSDGWRLVSHWYHDTLSSFLVHQELKSGRSYLNLRALDYAAECDFVAYRAENSGYILNDWHEIPPNYDYWKSNADPDKDGFTIWEEYRGFCDSSGAHFRLDIDTSAAIRRREVIVVDQDCILRHSQVNGFLPRLQEMMRCSLIVDSNIHTDTTRMPRCPSCVDVPWDRWERLDTYQGEWSESANDWVPNPLTDPLYSHPAPADSNGLARSSDQVAVRLLVPRFSGDMGANAYGRVCRFRHGGDQNWDYGICGVSGVMIDTGAIRTDLTTWWPHVEIILFLKSKPPLSRCV